MRLDTPSFLRSTLLVATVALTGCGDSTSSVGELGRLRYLLFTDYEVPEAQLDEARIVTGHTQRIELDMTSKGHDDISRPEGVRHLVNPAGDTEIRTLGSSEGFVPDFDLRVGEPGTYVVSSTLDGNEVDRIKLTFEAPASFDLLLKSRAPYASDFEPVELDATTELAEGSQLTIDAAPLDADGRRLAGIMGNDITIEPSWIAVPGVGVIESYENGIWTSEGQANFYFVEPGEATVTVKDPVSGASRSTKFTVTPIQK